MLDDLEKAILKILINCIIPADDHPDGWSAGVGDYLFQQFEGDLQDKVSDYHNGLSALNTEAQTVYEQDFVELSPEDRIQLLTQIEAGQIKSDAQNLPEFFAMTVEHTTEGYYSNPENGGNRNAVAWDMIGFEVTQ